MSFLFLFDYAQVTKEMSLFFFFLMYSCLATCLPAECVQLMGTHDNTEALVQGSEKQSTVKTIS